MAENHLEKLIAEFYEYQGYFIRRNVKVGLRKEGGHDGELDIVAFHPQTKHLIHLEPSLDTNSWEIREKRFKKKFDVGKEHIPKLFSGFDIPDNIEQVAVLYFGNKQTRQTVGGEKIMYIDELLEKILIEIKDKPLDSQAIPEHFSLLRTLQYTIKYQKVYKKVLG